jgi:Protein of unknown function (DUF1203)
MADIEFRPIAPDRLAAMRARDADDFGNPWTPFPARGWEPLRCCLRRPDRGESIALITYTPWTEPSPWMEAGPVFVHSGPCDGYPDTGRFPAVLADSPRMLNPFDRDGARAYDLITFVGPDSDGAADQEAAVRKLLDDPRVAFVHIRSTEAGCFTFEARRAPLLAK